MRFSLLSLSVLTLIAISLGWIIQREMENGALLQQTDEAAAILEGTLGRWLTPADLAPNQTAGERSRWANLTHRLLLADARLVRVKVWNLHGQVVYSNNPQQIGQKFPIDSNLRAALSGHRAMDVSNLSEAENAGDRQGYTSLLETYVPIYQGWGGNRHVVGAYEVYSDLRALQSQLDGARRVLWGTVSAGFVILYASLFAIVRTASRRLVRQMREISILGEQAREAETLRQVDRLKDEFIGSVSHELRRPLASIKGYASSLLLQNATWDIHLQREFLQVIDEEADHLSRLIDNLLDLARLGSGSLRFSVEPILLPALCGQVLRRVRLQAQLPPHEYGQSFSDRFPIVEADRERITQVVLNLVENAAKYSPPSSPIRIEGEAMDGGVVVRVTDQGPGLSEEQAQHVFDKFYRVDSGLTRTIDGTGLGLAISRGIVEAHGGHISVDTAPDRGCTFSFWLPAVLQETERGEISP